MKSRNCLSEWNHFLFCCVWAAKIPTPLRALLQLGLALKFPRLCRRLLWQETWESSVHFATKNVCHAPWALHCVLQWKPGSLGDAVLSVSSKPHGGRTRPSLSFLINPAGPQVDLRSDIWSTPWEVSSLPPGAQGTPGASPRLTLPHTPWHYCQGLPSREETLSHLTYSSKIIKGDNVCKHTGHIVGQQ